MSQQKLETLEEILDMWGEDSVIDPTELKEASLNTSKLHSKYLRIMMKHNLRLRTIEKKYDALFSDKSAYYSGKMPTERLKELGWEQFDYVAGRKGEVETYYKADKDLQNLEDLKFYHEKIIKTCEIILASLAGRSYHITNVVAIEKLRAGMG